MIKIIQNNNICAPQGFSAAGLHVGIRKNKDKRDLALIYSQIPATAAGVFTLNRVKAAPVLITQKHLQNGVLQAIVVNSGNANACTGEQGMLHAAQMAETVANELAIAPDRVAVASTGVIGEVLPIAKITQGICIACNHMSEDGDAAAEAIMTTDTRPKTIAIEMIVAGRAVRIGGIAKGSGMIHPNMATMLSFITTDAAISHSVLQQTLRMVNQATFNMITVDGDSSTNDMVLILANGLANNPMISSIDHPDWPFFYAGLLHVCTYLAKQIAQDGEGATKLLEVNVDGAVTEEQARMAARAICRSPLVKTAVFGEDPNWGRLVSALGASGAEFHTDQLAVELGNLLLFNQGTPLYFDELAARKILKETTIIVKINLGAGNARATAWGCDLTYDYIKINASYRS